MITGLTPEIDGFALSFRRNTVNDEADVMSSRILFHSLAPAEAKNMIVYLPTVTRRLTGSNVRQASECANDKKMEGI